MEPQSATEYIIEFRKYSVNCANVSESEAKFNLEIDLADWSSELVLPYNCEHLYTMILYTECISSI